MVLIRKLKQSDFEDFCRNELSYYRELKADPKFGIGTYGKKVARKTLTKQFSELLKDSKKGKLLVLVAENDKGRMIGQAEAFLGNALVEAPHVAAFGVSVIKDYRGKGIGTALVKELISRCKGKYEIATTGLFSCNKASKKLFTRLGFKVWGRGPNFAKRGKIYMDTELLYLRLKKQPQG